jgi:hypothetical protein
VVTFEAKRGGERKGLGKTVIAGTTASTLTEGSYTFSDFVKNSPFEGYYVGMKQWEI